MDGEEALEYLQKAQVLPDLILLDVMMPAMSGFEVGTCSADCVLNFGIDNRPTPIEIFVHKCMS